MSQRVIRIVLIVLTLISIYAVGFRMGIAPPIFGSSEKYAAINEILTSLSLSFLAALVFYILTVALPDYVNKRKANTGLKTAFEQVYSDMSYVISALLMIAGIEATEKDVEERDWECFSNDNVILQKQWYVHRYSFLNEVLVNHIRGWVDAEHDLLRKVKAIKKQIENINMSPLARGLSLDTLDLLRSIHQSSALHLVEVLLGSRKILESVVQDSKIGLSMSSQFPHDMVELSKCHLELGSLCNNHTDYKFEKMTDEEIAKFKQERNAILGTLSHIDDMRSVNEFEESMINGIRVF